MSKVDEAVAKVTKAVKRLSKGERNQHGGYNFAGIDDFLEMTGKLCGDAGLNVVMDEEEFEVIEEFFATKNGKVAALRMRFAIWLKCEGEKDGPYHRSIMVPANMGSQAFGAGQSYVLKQFLRATFQIPTGDKNEDIDAHDTGTMARSHQPEAARISDEQLANLQTLTSQAGTDLKNLCTFFKIASLPELPATAYDALFKKLKKDIAAKAQPQDMKEAA
jgi:hypothetical protein